MIQSAREHVGEVQSTAADASLSELHTASPSKQQFNTYVGRFQGLALQGFLFQFEYLVIYLYNNTTEAYAGMPRVNSQITSWYT